MNVEDLVLNLRELLSVAFQAFPQSVLDGRGRSESLVGD